MQVRVTDGWEKRLEHGGVDGSPTPFSRPQCFVLGPGGRRMILPGTETATDRVDNDMVFVRGETRHVCFEREC